MSTSLNFNRNDGSMNYSIAQNNESRVDRRKFSGHYTNQPHDHQTYERQSFGSSSVPKLGGGKKKGSTATSTLVDNSR